MNRSRSIIAAVTVAACLLFALVALAACAPAAVPAAAPNAAPTAVPAIVPTAMPPEAPTAAAPAQAPAVVPAPATTVGLKLAQSDKFGKILSDAEGRTLYLFTKDTKNTSNCYDACAKNWPPLLSQDKPSLGDGLNADLLGTTQRKDGTTQLTYNGWPVYYWASDKNPGDTLGQGVGGVWWVITPEGDPIKTAASPTAVPAAPTSAPASVATVGIKLAQSDKFGKILADADGRTLYLFTKDTKNTSNCYDACAKNWPPLLSQDKPSLGDGLDAALLGTTQRKDGTTQLTYNGSPLYYWAADKNPGDTLGQGVGKVWWVITAAGDAITDTAAPAAAPTSAPKSAPGNGY